MGKGKEGNKIKRCLLLGRKVMTNLDSIFKSRDITLSTMVHLVKAMVFPVVMYGCESWTVKKAERRRIDAFGQPTRLPHPWDSPGKNTGVGCYFLLQCMKVKSQVKSLSRV